MIITNSFDFIEFNNQLISVSNNFIDIKISSDWINHCNNCMICNKFYDKIKTIDKSDWFILINKKWYRMDFLNLNQIGNGTDILLTGTSPGWFILDDIQILDAKSNELMLNRSYKIDCLGI